MPSETLYQQAKAAQENKEDRLYRKLLHQAAEKAHPRACYEYALLQKDRDPNEYTHYLLRAAEGGHPKALKEQINQCKKSKDRTLRYEADQWMLRAYALGIPGYEFPVAHMLFYGLGYLSRLPLAVINQSRAVQILLYEKPSPKRSLTLGRFLLECRSPFSFHKAQDAQHYAAPKVIGSAKLPYAPAEAINWLLRADCAEGYARIARFYWQEGNEEQALGYYRKAESCKASASCKLLRQLSKEMGTLLAEQSPEEKLAFLFYSEDPQHRLQVLKKALWAVTSEGYCRIMQESLDRGQYDPEAEEWKLLFPLKDDIAALYEVYRKRCQGQ